MSLRSGTSGTSGMSARSAPPAAGASRGPNRRASGSAVAPWATTLSSTVLSRDAFSRRHPWRVMREESLAAVLALPGNAGKEWRRLTLPG
jgi:hypothetical protein